MEIKSDRMDLSHGKNFSSYFWLSFLQERDEQHFSQFVTGEPFAQYSQRKRQDGVHGNHAEIQAISELFNRPVEVFCPGNGAAPLNIFHAEYKTDDAPIRLSYHDGNHYNAVVDPLVPTAGLGLGLPGLQPGLADKMQMAKAVAESDAVADQMEFKRALKESQDDELQRAIKESSLSVEHVSHSTLYTLHCTLYAYDTGKENSCRRAESLVTHLAPLLRYRYRCTVTRRWRCRIWTQPISSWSKLPWNDRCSRIQIKSRARSNRPRMGDEDEMVAVYPTTQAWPRRVPVLVIVLVYNIRRQMYVEDLTNCFPWTLAFVSYQFLSTERCCFPSKHL
jgi:hypothetical protein